MMMFFLAATANACSMVDLVCLFMKTHLLALLQDNCLDFLHCASCTSCLDVWGI